jgi:REP element-mobilizing transposase RayT
MARHIRKQFHGAKCHVTNRGNGRQEIFAESGDCDRFMEQLAEAVEMDGVILYAYCLMPNHFHLFVKTPNANLDRFMGRLTTAYAIEGRTPQVQERQVGTRQMVPG